MSEIDTNLELTFASISGKSGVECFSSAWRAIPTLLTQTLL